MASLSIAFPNRNNIHQPPQQSRLPSLPIEIRHHIWKTPTNEKSNDASYLTAVPPQSGLLSLPPELRNVIWKYVVFETAHTVGDDEYMIPIGPVLHPMANIDQEYYNPYALCLKATGSHTLPVAMSVYLARKQAKQLFPTRKPSLIWILMNLKSTLEQSQGSTIQSDMLLWHKDETYLANQKKACIPHPGLLGVCRQVRRETRSMFCFKITTPLLIDLTPDCIQSFCVWLLSIDEVDISFINLLTLRFHVPQFATVILELGFYFDEVKSYMKYIAMVPEPPDWEPREVDWWWLNMATIFTALQIRTLNIQQHLLDIEGVRIGRREIVKEILWHYRNFHGLRPRFDGRGQERAG